MSGGGMIADPICDHALLISSQGAGARCMGCAGAPPAPQRLPGHIQRRCDGCEGKPSSEHTVHDLAQESVYKTSSIRTSLLNLTINWHSATSACRLKASWIMSARMLWLGSHERGAFAVPPHSSRKPPLSLRKLSGSRLDLVDLRPTPYRDPHHCADFFKHVYCITIGHKLDILRLIIPEQTRDIADQIRTSAVLNSPFGG